MFKDDSEPDDFQSVNYNIKIKAELDKRISNHVRALKHLEGRGYSKKRWVQEAIKEKIQNYESLSIEEIESDCNLNFAISRYLNEEIIKIIEFLKKLNVRVSKTDFFLDAIYEKLQKEELSTKELFQGMLKANTQPSESFTK